MARLENNDILPIAKAFLKIKDEEMDAVLDILITETMVRVENYLNQPPPAALKYAVARLTVAAYNVTFDDNAGRGVASITEDKRQVVFEKASDSAASAMAEMALDIKADLHRYRVMRF